MNSTIRDATLCQYYTSGSEALLMLKPALEDPMDLELSLCHSVEDLEAFRDKLSTLRIFDPAAGEGNLLAAAMETLEVLDSRAVDRIRDEGLEPLPSRLSCSQLYAIEIDEGAASRCGDRLPGAVILNEDATKVDWAELCPPGDEVLIVCNPPYRGAEVRSPAQKEAMDRAFKGFGKYKRLDFSAAWVWLAANYMSGTGARSVFVTTSSICQGVQVAALWPPIIELGVELEFAYRPHIWRAAGADAAGVYVAILGMTAKGGSNRRLFTEAATGWVEVNPDNISPYLLPGKNVVVEPERQPPAGVARMTEGNHPTDGGNLLLTRAEKEELVRTDPAVNRWVRPVIGAEEYLHSKERWCLWLVGAGKEEIESMPAVRERVERVRRMRAASKSKATQKTSAEPHLFVSNRQPERGSYLLVPCVTSERREYAPVGSYGSDTIATNKVHIVPGATYYEFAILCSRMQMDWLRLAGGRLGESFRYSAALVYNTFPWPDCSPADRARLEELGKQLIIVRNKYYDDYCMTPAEVYAPSEIPEDLLDRHRAIDLELEWLIAGRPLETQAERQEFLLDAYAKRKEGSA